MEHLDALNIKSYSAFCILLITLPTWSHNSHAWPSMFKSVGVLFFLLFHHTNGILHVVIDIFSSYPLLKIPKVTLCHFSLPTFFINLQSILTWCINSKGKSRKPQFLSVKWHSFIMCISVSSWGRKLCASIFHLLVSSIQSCDYICLKSRRIVTADWIVRQ